MSRTAERERPAWWRREATSTFFAGHACILLQFQTLEVEGITVVSERHPCPRAQSVWALARVGPLVRHRLVWSAENTINTQFMQIKVQS